MISPEIFMLIGFIFSAYAIVANDAIQTLGTFIAANKDKHWLYLWAFASGILSIVLLYGWYFNQGDPAYGRLTKFYFDPSQTQEIYSFLCIIPPLMLLILTRFGLPVSTTFLILTFFKPKNLIDMVNKSLLGYALALFLGIIVFLLVKRIFNRQKEDDLSTPEIASWWTPVQWLSTGFLWSQWLIQDLANLFIYFPRQGPEGQAQSLTFSWLITGLLIMVIMQVFIFRDGGGKIQEIVDQKSGSSDIREATMINFVYAIIILFFKEYSNLPMSTTWVFLGLLAGREIAYHWTVIRSHVATWKMIVSDLIKATIGLVVSVIIALGLPWLSQIISG